MQCIKIMGTDMWSSSRDRSEAGTMSNMQSCGPCNASARQSALRLWMPHPCRGHGMLCCAVEGIRGHPRPHCTRAEAVWRPTGEVSFHSGWTFHRADGNSTDQPRKVMTVIYMDKDMRVIEPQHANHRADLNWCDSSSLVDGCTAAAVCACVAQ